jgi:Ca-activated chloride channel family protein
MPEALTAMHFIRPWWLLALLPLLPLVIRWARRRATGSHWETAIEPGLLSVLLEPGERPRARRLPWLVAATLAITVLGLAGPTWQRLPQPVEQKNDALVILFDLSLSMFARDVSPSRLVRARQKIADVLRRREEGFTALVAYAGDAHAVVPLTDDTRTIENLLSALRPDMMPVLGSNLGSAMAQAQRLFDNAGVSQGRILVVTDAVEDPGDVVDYRRASFPISILGVGTADGAAIPLDFVNQPGQVLRTQQGDPIVARLDATALESLTESTYGRYRTMTLADGDIDALLATPLPGEDDTAEVDREFDAWADAGYWVCLLLIPVLLTAFRRGTLAVLPISLAPILLLPAPADAGVWDDFWRRPDQQAYTALRDGEPERAAGLFEDGAWRAAADYRNEAFERAAEHYRGDPSIDGLYNLGNALAQQQDFQGAIDAYDRVLAQNPDHDDARHNKAIVERAQQEQAEAQDDDDSRQQPGDDDEPPTPPESDGESGEGDATQDGTPPQQPPETDNEEPESATPAESSEGESEEEMTASRDEKQDALEQWLRRVPDDPGGLLRRKFQYETNQRLRQGDYRSRETDRIW